MTETNQNVSMFAGDTKHLETTVTDDAGAAKTLGGATIRYAMATSPQDEAVVSKATPDDAEISIDSPSEGVFTIHLDPADTEALTATTYYHEAEVTDSQGNVATVFTGSVSIRPSVV